ncbi:hypothetical protein AB0F72_08335 [Actinoplanes sp. NPDC023936]|uniref:hypothetical protein n=1 Tax=Actinoplanes sp. NPDC023936 TaxID=3154910 RepID=UPI0033EAA4AB
MPTVTDADTHLPVRADYAAGLITLDTALDRIQFAGTPMPRDRAARILGQPINQITVWLHSQRTPSERQIAERLGEVGA